jgi:diaminopimelate decarboxylase
MITWLFTREFVCMMVRHDISNHFRAPARSQTMKSKRSFPDTGTASRAVDPTRYTPDYVWRRTMGSTGRNSSEALYCEGVPLTRIVESTATPAYVYSGASIRSAYSALDRAFGSLPHTICYAVKANSNLSVLRILARKGSSFDVVSGGELDRLRRIGVPGNRIVFSGVGKTREEIRAALEYRAGSSDSRRIGRKSSRGILLFNVESAAELDALLAEAERHVGRAGRRPAVAMRVNPDVMAGGHPHISTGHHHHKFGVGWPEARRLYLEHKSSRWIQWRGISAHIGSQIVSVAPYRRALARLASYVRDLAKHGIRLDLVDIGGGLGIRYEHESPLVPAAFARALSQIVRPLGSRLLIEPGRAIAGPAGVLLTRVLYAKENGGKTFVIVDAAMNDLIRPVLYDATHAITPAVREANARSKTKRVDIVGPVCESGDFLARDRFLPPVKPGDLLVIWAAGAYGFAQSSNYNARRRAAEVLVDGRRFHIVRRRETYDDLVRGESLR